MAGCIVAVSRQKIPAKLNKLAGAESTKSLTWFRGDSDFLQKSRPFREGRIELGENQVKSLLLFSRMHQSLSASFDLTREKFDFQKNWLPDLDSNQD